MRHILVDFARERQTASKTRLEGPSKESSKRPAAKNPLSACAVGKAYQQVDQEFTSDLMLVENSGEFWSA
ncbi:MAG TPA: hypothetical protein VFS12_10565 [Terriglobia bacterium]|nr:hypothetical protein [Terriglobia bacterium]